ncbi:P-loop containing nucleoside triphosphate hydrolase protein [Phlyctochytrium arcticum]|nr:P-loop containing nucleoside triphosphate hydrolase protein [Phlyctochytrium arcticum]
MVPKKAQSKRTSAAKKYKIEKKVAEHHRKLRKEARKNPTSKKLKKDPGIPNLFPFKEKLLQQAEESKRKAQEEKERQKEARKALTNKNRSLSSDQLDLAALARDAAKRSNVYDSTQSIHGPDSFFAGNHVDAAAAGLKDNSRKAYYKEFKKVVENADVILEVLDARDPLGCRTRQIEEMILNSGASKRVILILNKIDLVPREVVEQWLKYLRNEFPTIAFKASTQAQRSNLGQSTVSTNQASEGLLSSSECLGADNLMKLLKNYCRNANIKTSVTVGVIGFPNVGKSSVINSLKRSKVCNVGATPGVTKVAQTIQLDKNVKLLDCPGIVFSQSTREGDEAEVLLRNCVKVELLDDPIAPVEVIISRCKQEQLMKIYSVPPFTDTRDFLIQIARQRGKLRRGGIPDLENAARSILQDWNTGRIPFYTIPPAAGLPVTSHVDSSIVQAWSKEFELPELFDTEDNQILSAVKSQNQIPTRLLAMQSGSAAVVNMDMEDLPEGFRDADVPSEDDEDRMDESDDDEIEEDSDEAPDAVPMEVAPTRIKPEIRFKEPPAKKSVSFKNEKEEPALNAAEMEINPQVNKNRKKQLKQQKKLGKKSAKSASDSMVEESYDFSEHFAIAQLPGADSDDEDL